jgi:hypothetical protein
MLRNLSDLVLLVNEVLFSLEKTMKDDKEACDPVVREAIKVDFTTVNGSPGKDKKNSKEASWHRPSYRP